MRAGPALRPWDGLGVRDGLRVGIDIVMIEAVERSVCEQGERYLERLFTTHERACCTGEPGVVAASLAARLAAKEATVKVLRPYAARPEWRSIEVRREPAGWCWIQLSGSAAALAAAAGLGELAVSLSHEGPLAVAVVVGAPAAPGGTRSERAG